MDLWLDTPGSFPNTLKVAFYKALIKPGNPPRRGGLGDVMRNSLRVTTDPYYYYRYPGAYLDDLTGDRLIVSSTTRPSTIVINGVSYSLSGFAPGLAYDLITL